MRFRPSRLTAAIFHLLMATALAVSLFPTAGPSLAAASSIDFSGPPDSKSFGATVKTLPNGNIVVTDPDWQNAIGNSLGKVYLYSTALHLISEVTGQADGDKIGSGGIIVLDDGNYVISSPKFGSAYGHTGAGAVTWCSGATGCSGEVDLANSLTGSHTGDDIGSSVRTMPGGAYLVSSMYWDTNKGAVTFCAALNACHGEIVSSANSLVGTTGQSTGTGGTTLYGDWIGWATQVLPDGSYVTYAPYWNNNTPGKYVGVVVPCPNTGCRGEVSTSNGLYGSTQGDTVGTSITVLPDNAFIVSSIYWHKGGVQYIGAVTYCAGITDSNCVGKPVSAANSLTGRVLSDYVGWPTALSDGNYVVTSNSWKNDASLNVGAATFCAVSNHVSSCTGATVTAANSLIGTQNGDSIGSTVALPGGKYLITSSSWNAYRGSVTFCGANGAGCVGQTVSASNSLVGNNGSISGADGDQLSRSGIKVLPDGGYLVNSSWLDVNTVDKAGAITHCPATGCTGPVSLANSLMGSHVEDQIGEGGIELFDNGAFVVSSPSWNNGATAKAGAATYCASATACENKVIGADNSLVGDAANEAVGTNYMTYRLSNRAYLVVSRWGGYDAVNDAAPGAVTYCAADAPCTGVVGPSNSLVGSQANDVLFYASTEEISDGFYVVASYNYQNGSATAAGAVSLCNIAGGCTGPITSDNSVIGGITDGGWKINYSHDTYRKRLIIGRPAENLITLLDTSAAGDKTAVTVGLASSVANHTTTYGDSLTLTATVAAAAGTPTGDVTFKDGATTLCANAALDSGTASCTLTNLAAGQHISLTAEYNGDSSYNIGAAPAITHTVSPAVLTVAASNATRTYGNANPTFTGTLSGFKNSETILTSGVSGAAVCTSAATGSSPTANSPYPITCAAGTLTATNYIFAFTPGELTITRAPLSVKADATRAYGDPNPTPTPIFTGFKNGETQTTAGITGAAACTTTATAASTVAGGPYPVDCTQGTLTANNYSFVFSTSSLTVTKSALTVKANDKSRLYGEPNPPLNATISGFKNGETITTSGVSGAANCITNAGPASPVNGSPYPITCTDSTLAAANYSFTFVPGNLTVNPLIPEVTLGNLSQIYDGQPKPVTVTVTPTSLSTTVIYSGTHGTVYGPLQQPPSGAGKYIVTATVTGTNYETTTITGTLTVWIRLVFPMMTNFGRFDNR
jgi:hypothetical protein